MAETDANEGQAAPAEPQGTTAAAPNGSEGQSTDRNQTTAPGTDDGQGESFFDPESIKGKPELEAAYKEMQRAWSKKTAALAKDRKKVEAYDQAMRDPQGTIRNLAQQYGMTVVDGQPTEQEFKPNSWEDVVSHITEKVQKDLQKQYEPIIGEVKNLKQRNIEQYLDSSYPDWRTYEQEMIETLGQHPSLASDPDALYRMTVPQDVIERRAMDRAMKKLKGSEESGQVSGANKATQVTLDRPSGPLSFDDAVKLAKDKLRAKGITPPAAG